MTKNNRCPLQKECGKKCEYVHNELECIYYKNNGIGDNTIPDQEERRAILDEQAEDALFEEELANIEEDKGGIVWIDIDCLIPHPDNPRKDLGDLTELSDSIKAKGVLQNLTVVPFKSRTNPKFKGAGYYTVVIGHRRLEAAKLAGLTELPCIITEMTPAEQVQTMLLENMQRADLTVYEQAQGFQMMLDLGDTVDGISEKTGFSKTTVRRRLKMAELNQDTLKEVSCRQLSLMDFDRLYEIKDLKRRNKVLEQIGTNNFEAVYYQAIQDQKREENTKCWREELDKYNATEIPEKDVWSNKYISLPYAYLSDNPEEKLKELFAGEGPFYYCITRYNYIYLRKSKSQDEINAISERNSESEKKEARRRQKESALSEAFERAYELRYNFIKSFSESTAKKCIKDAVRAILINIYYYSDMPDIDDLAELLGINLSGEDDRDVDICDVDMKTINDISIKPYRNLIAIAYSTFEDSERKTCYNYSLEYRENKSLSRLYEFLTALGYEMSDEEISLMDGTSALYGNVDNENDKIESAEAELSEEEEQPEADDLSKDDTEYNEMLDKLRAEYEGDDDDE